MVANDIGFDGATFVRFGRGIAYFQSSVEGREDTHKDATRSDVWKESLELSLTRQGANTSVDFGLDGYQMKFAPKQIL